MQFNQSKFRVVNKFLSVLSILPDLDEIWYEKSVHNAVKRLRVSSKSEEGRLYFACGSK